MKKALLFLLLSIFTLPSFAQKADDCPALDWVRDINVDSSKYYYSNKIFTKDNGAIVLGWYFAGVQNVAGLNVPPLTVNTATSPMNGFIMKIDSTGKGEWIIPIEVTEERKYSHLTLPSVSINSLVLDEEDNIHLIMDFWYAKVLFKGKKYEQLEKWDKNGKRYLYYFKINPQGQIVKEHTFEENKNGNNPIFMAKIMKATASDSSLIMSVLNGNIADSIKLFNQVYPSRQGAIHIFRMNSRFEIEWLKNIGLTEESIVSIYSVKETINKNELRILGDFIPKDSGLDIDGYFIKRPIWSWARGIFVTTLNTKTGAFYNTETIMSAVSSAHNTLTLPLYRNQDFVGIRGQATYHKYRGFDFTNSNLIAFDELGNEYYVFAHYDSVLLFNEKIFYFNSSSTQFVTGGKGILLLKYNPLTKEYAMYHVKGVADSLNKYYYMTTPSVIYQPKHKQVLLSGCFSKGFNEVKIDSTEWYNAFLISVNPNEEDVYDEALWLKKLNKNWEIYSQNVDSPAFLYWEPQVDKKGDIRLFGTYLKRNFFDWKTLGSKTDEDQNFGCFDAKLTALTSHIQHDATRMRAAQENAQYQWYDCGNNMQAVSGATDRYFTPSNVNGKYAVKVSNSWCSVMSDCQKLSVPLVNNLHSVQIYPNPVSHTLYLAHLPVGVDVAVFDMMGRKIFSSYVQQSSFKINTESWTQGVYLVQLDYRGERWMEKVVK